MKACILLVWITEINDEENCDNGDDNDVDDDDDDT